MRKTKADLDHQQRYGLPGNRIEIQTVRTYLERLPTWFCSSLRDLSPCFQQGAGRRCKPQRVGGRISLSGLVLAARPPIGAKPTGEIKAADWRGDLAASAGVLSTLEAVNSCPIAAVIEFGVRRTDLWRFRHLHSIRTNLSVSSKALDLMTSRRKL